MNGSMIFGWVLSGVAIIVSVVAIVATAKREAHHEDKDEGINKGIILTRLDSIALSVNEIKQDIRDNRNEQKELRDKVVELSQKVKALEKVVFTKED